MANNKINFQVGFSVDKSGLSQMQSLFQQIAFSAQEPGNKLNTELQQAAKTASTLDGILSRTFNTELGTLNVTKFNQELKNSGLTLKTVQSDFSKIGTQGADAYNRLAQAVLGTNQQLKQSSKLLNDMFTTFKNTVRYGISSSIFNNMSNSIQKAYDYTKQLDTSLNDIRIVTDKSSESMADFAQQANEAAKSLGASTLDYTNASLIYYQQGLSDAEVAARAETTIKAANVTGQTGEEVSEQLTAVWNGYKVTAAETELYVDKLAAVAATTAADLEELSTGMSKVASAANAMGVDFDDLNAQIATIVSVTRQAPESVGTALKTIYARLGDLKVDGVDEFGVSLGEVSSQMVQMGIQILDQEGNLRDMSSVIAEVAEKWTGWTEAQRQAAAVAMAGKRQYNNLIALFDNWDMYTEALNTSTEAVGTLQQQQDIYMESTAAKLKTLKAAWQGLYDDAINEDEINAGIEALTNLVEVFDNFIDSYGGGIKAIGGFGAIISSIFNKQIADSINAANQRIQVFKNNLELAKTANDIRIQGSSPEGSAAIQANTDIQVEYSKRIYEARLGLNQEQANTLINYQKEIGTLEEQIVKEQQLLDKKALEANLSEKEINQIQSYVMTLDDVNAKYGTITEELANGKTYLDESSRIINTQFKKGFEDSAEIETQMAQILTVIQNQSLDILNLDKADNGQLKLKVDKLQKIFDEVSQSATATDDVKTKSQEILQLVNEIQQSYKREIELQNKRSQAANTYVKTLEEQRNNQERQNNIKQQADDMLDLANNATTVVQRVTAITSALGNMAMAWSSINSLIDTWNNEQASFGDKLTQTFMTLGMSLPIVITNFNKLNELLNVSNSLSAIFSTTKAAELAIQVKENELLKEEALSRGVNIAALDKETVSRLKGVAVQQVEEVSTNKLTAAWWRLNVAMDANPIGVIILALTALAAAVAGGIAVFDALTVSAEEAGEAVKDSANKWTETTTEIDNLNTQLETLKERLEELKELNDSGKISITEKEELIRLQAENDELEAQLALKEKLEKAQSRDVADKAKQAAEKDSFNTQSYNEKPNVAYVGGFGIKRSDDVSFHLDDNIPDIRTINALDTEAYQQWDTAANQLIDQARAEALNHQKEEQDLNPFNNYYQDALNSLEEQYKTFSKRWNDANQEAIQNLQSGYEEAKTYLDALYAQNNNDEYKDTIQYYENIVLEYYKASGTLEKNVAEAFNSALKNQEEFDKIVNEASSILNQESQTADENKLTELIGKESFDTLKQYSEETKISLYTLIELASEGKVTFQQLDEEVDNTLSGQQAKVTKFLGYLDSSLSSGKLTEDQISEIEKSLKALEAEYPSLAAIQDRTSTAYYNKLLAIREALEEQDKLLKQQQENQQIDEATDIIVDIESNGGEEALEEKLLDICNTDYEVLVSVKSDIQDDFDTTVGAMESINEMASKIGDDFIVAAEDIEELNNVFPGILNNMELVGDGTVKLNADIVKGAMEAAEAEVAADTDATISKLQNQADELAVKRDAAKQIATSATNLAKHETQLDNEKGKINDALEQLKIDNSETTSQNQQQDQIDTAENAAQAATSMANSFKGAYANMSQNAKEWANIAYQAFQAAQGKIDPASIAEFSGADFQTTSNVQQIQSDKKELNNMEAYDQGDWQEVADYYNNLAESYDEAYNSVLGKIGELTARGQEVGTSLDNISKGTGSDGEKSSGGSSGGSSEDRDKELKQLEEEFDRYWELNKALDSLDRQLKKIDKDQENLYGKELISSLKQENELLANQTQLYEQLAAAQQQEAAELRGTLSSNGVVFDASGAIVNYAQATAAALQEYNDAVTAYNNGLLDDAALEIHEQKFEQFKEDLERYDTLFYTEMQDTMEKIDDLRRQTLENNLKAWETEIQLKLDTEELERDWNDFLKEITEDFQSVFKDLRVDLNSMVSDALSYASDDGTINTTISAIHDVTNEIDKLMNGGTSDMFESVSQAQEKLKELNEQLIDAGQALHDLWEEAWDSYLEGIDQVADKFDDLIDRFETINDELEFQGKLIELLYGDEAYELMSKLYEGQEKSTENQIQSLKTQADMWEDLFYSSGATLENQSSWTEDQKKYYEEWQEAQSSLNDLVIDYIELLQKDYLNTISDILSELEESITGSSLEDINTEWERISANADKYYDSVEGAYYIQTLANKIDQSIASTTSLQAQQKLMELREKEISYLQEKENLTEYDIQAAEQRYQIALKEIALEEAQNNKTGMKLTRNEQGNWSYQYVADEDDIATKQQELLDAYNNLYQLASDAYESNLESLQELQEKYLESAEEIASDTTLTEEEKQAKLLELREWYLEQYQILAEENQLYRNDLATSGAGLLLEIYKQDQEAYESMTGHERELIDALTSANINDYMELEEKLKENYQNIGDKAKEVMSETRLDWTSGAQTLADLWNKDGGSSVKSQIVQAYNAIIAANLEYQNKVDQLAITVERDFSEEGISGAIKGAADETDDLKDKTIEMVSESVDYLNDLKMKVNEIEEAWEDVQDDIQKAIDLIKEYLQKSGEASTASSQSTSSGSGSGSSSSSSGSGSSGSSSSGSSGSSSSGKTVTGTRTYTVSNGAQMTVTTYSDGSHTVTWGANSNLLSDKEKESIRKAYGFDTGGYTGSWGDNSGKLAMLHQKELVLNADDTSNFLSAINTIRTLSSSVGGSIQDAVLKAVANTALSLGTIKTTGFSGDVSNNNSTTDNVFNITAEFPNANSVDDIREAILSLPNLASQYANSTLK